MTHLPPDNVDIDPRCVHCGFSISGQPPFLTTPAVVERAPVLCPVCGGRGTVSHNFYTGGHGAWKPGMERVTCRTCHGRGVI